MENKGKRNRMRFFASCLAVVMCLSMVDTSLFFPVSAEGETTPVEQTPEIAQTDPAVEGQPEETAPEEGTEPGTEMPEPDVPAVEEEPVDPKDPVNNEAVLPEEEVQKPEEPEAENPDIISVQTLEAKVTAGEIRADDVITDFDVKDTEGHPLEAPVITGIRLGWVRNAGLQDELELSGKHYTLKGVKVDGKECLYITKYNNDYYYSYDGESGIKVNTNQRFVIEYWQYHNVTFSGENIDKLDVSVEKQELKYGDDTSLSLKSFVSSPEKVLAGNVYKVYIGKELRWEKYRGKDTENRIEYLISDVLVNGTAGSEFAKEGEAVEEVIRDTEIVVNGAENSSPRVDFANGNISSKDPVDLVFQNATHEILFTITTQRALGKTGLVLDGELNEIVVPSNRETAKKTVIPNSPYVITVEKTSGQYEYKFTVTRSDGNPIREDLEFVSEDKTSWWSSDVNISNNAEEVIVAKLTGHNVSVISPPDNSYKVNLRTPSITIFMKAQPGYILKDLPVNVPDDSLGAWWGNLSVKEDSISNYPDDSIKEKAMRMGFTHYAVLTRDKGIFTSFTVNVIANPIAAEYRISGETDKITNYREKASYTLPQYNSDSSEFHGWKLNGNDQRLYQPGETFELTDRTWNLGTLENPDNPDSTRIFNFEPVTGNEYYSYTIEHYLQNNDGSYPTDPSETAKGVSLQTSGSYVVGIPRVYSDHTFDSTVEGTKQGIDFSDSTDSRVIKLYYRKNFQYANVQIATHIDGKFADKNKKFTYTVKAEKEDASNRIDPLKDDVFKSEGWKRDPDGNYYVKSFEHGAEEVYDLGNVPVTNCKYTVSLNGENAFYETTKHTVENGTATTPVSGASHTFAGSAMTPNAIHEVHFTHTASDVVPAGNIFEDKGFDLMLATTAVLGLLCAVYAVFRRRMQIR